MVADQDQPLEHTKDSNLAWTARDTVSFLAAIRPWQASVCRILSRVLGDRHDAEDVWQSLVLRWWQSPGNLPAPDKFPAWLRRCAVNEAIRVLRRQKKLNHHGIDNVPARQVGPWEALTTDELRTDMRRAMLSLDPEDRALLALRFDEGLTIREIAEVLERPPATVYVQLERVVDRLRKLLGIHFSEQRKS